MTDDKTPDPVPSPAPVSAPSSETQPAPEANPEPEAGGDKAAPPTASDDKATAPAADDGIPSEEEVLERLTGGEQKKDTKTPAVPAKADAPEGTKDPAAPEADKPEEEVEDPNAEFVEPTAEELASYHSKTRRRIQQVLTKWKDDAPFAAFARRHLASLDSLGVTPKGVDDWLGLGADLKRGDPEAIQALARIVESHGYKAPAEAAPELDTSSLKGVLARLKRDGHINDAAEEDILGILPAVKAKAPAPAQRPAPQAQAQAQAPAPAPQPRQPTPVEHWQAAAAPVKARVTTLIDGYASGHGAKAKEITQAVLTEITTIEAKLPQDQQFDLRLWESRARLAISRVHSRLSSAPRPTVQPSLRGGTAPVTIKSPEQGTEAFDMALLTGR